MGWVLHVPDKECRALPLGRTDGLRITHARGEEEEKSAERINLPSWNMKAPSKYSWFESGGFVGRLNSIIIWGPAETNDSGEERVPLVPRTVLDAGEQSL